MTKTDTTDGRWLCPGCNDTDRPHFVGMIVFQGDFADPAVLGIEVDLRELLASVTEFFDHVADDL